MSSNSSLLKNTFSKVVNDYDWARPTYPRELYDKVLEFSKIGTQADVLEVGAGTGQATDLFVVNDFLLELLEVSESKFFS